jgi:hypothetical protein
LTVADHWRNNTNKAFENRYISGGNVWLGCCAFWIIRQRKKNKIAPWKQKGPQNILDNGIKELQKWLQNILDNGIKGYSYSK